MKAAIYFRVSTTDKGQDTAMQETACVDLCKQRGWDYVIYTDHASGRKLKKRPELLSLIQEIEAGRVNVVIAYKLDRLSRSLQDLVRISNVLQERECGLVMVTQGEIDTTASHGRLFFSMLGAIAQFESDMISERVRDGMAQKKREGRKFGGDRRSTEAIAQRISEKLAKGWLLLTIRQKLRLRRNSFYAAIEHLEQTLGKTITDDTDERKKSNVRHFPQKKV